MIQIPRILENTLQRELSDAQKVTVIYGPRQAGKTSLVRKVIGACPEAVLEINADEERYVDVLSSRDGRRLSELASGYKLLFIDEAQRVPNIGLSLKILLDQHPDLKIIVTGSSALELASGLSEPLTGRKWTYQLFPIAQVELRMLSNRFELKSELETRLVFGSYPEIFNLPNTQRKIQYLRELSTDYLYKDILKLADIRNPNKIRQLLKLLAFQVGNEVSLNELGNALDMGKETVARYIDLLEKSFVLFHLSGFSRNLRKEVSKSNKYYFYDLGIRNAVIENFSLLSDRNDQSALWENFLISERIKRNHYTEGPPQAYFWRVYSGAEIDYVEDRNGKLSGYEIKFGARKPRQPTTFLSEYQESSWSIINQDNWLDFVLADAPS